MRRRVMTALVAIAAMFAWGAGPWAVVSTAQPLDTDVADTSDTNEPAVQQDAQLVEQAQRAHSNLLDHHAQVVAQRERVQEAVAAHHERTRAALGDGAPTATIAPMPTVPPLAD